MSDHQRNEARPPSDLSPRVDRRLAATLVKLRHCAPGAELGRPDRPEERALLEELLALQDRVDPVRWLRAERGDTVARLTLRTALLTLRREFESHRAHPGPRPDLPAEAQAIWADFARAWVRPLEGPDPFVELDDPDDRAGLLREILSRVRALRPRYADPSGAMPGGELPLLIDDLLQLPDDVDPVRWLRKERSEWGARMVLHRLLAAVWPARGLAIGDPVSRLQPRQTSVFPGRAQFMIEELVLSPRGFMIDLTVRTSREKLPVPPGIKIARLRWQGFDEVRDDRGYDYLVVPPGGSGTVYSSGDTDRRSIVYHPGVAAGAVELIFSSTPVRFTVTGFGQEGHRELPDLELGDLVWRFALPR